MDIHENKERLLLLSVMRKIRFCSAAHSALQVPHAQRTNRPQGRRTFAKRTFAGRHGRTDMPRTTKASKRTSRKEVVPVLGAVGVSLSLASGASAATAVPVADTPSKDTALNPHVTLNEEEIADVNLGTFFVFDKEAAGTPQLGQQYARGCGCRGCGCRGCGCRGCR